ncbi:hypothetical protein [Acinetobacter tjernbergiae]|uniref:WavQ n=1 Tax=Acinetobacter tjernbergiae DSM 14971 = CIP 107465 TaxID=1120928 RepID=V2V393_9GAMM|nr:hypothetical protein [Acinetobacter tjernbergiae]ESK56747.1 hypothetical protein F990_00819 [Acinetobacter tjernbergiae DSM 14971 = CIP 107465]
MMHIFIYCYPYNENSGGVIALHRLCHLINEATCHKAYLVPHRKFGLRHDIKNIFKKKEFNLHGEWNTPIWRKFFFPNKSSCIVIYPEIVSGNPLRINRVVRWFLHNPGYFTGEINYGENELYYRYSSGFFYKVEHNSTLSNLILNVKYTPFDIYFENIINTKDIESCHMVRKGGGKKIVHSNDSICLDNKNHKEIADIFRRAKRFISYDPYTAYSHFAVLCGCESIIVPDEGVSVNNWYSDTSDRFGLSYGFDQDQLNWASNTRQDLVDKLKASDSMCVESVKECLNEMLSHFK